MADASLGETPPNYGEKVPLVATRLVRTYPARWFVLATFFSHMAMTNIIWATFSPIADLTKCYYGVGLFWVNSLSWIYMSSYVPGFLLASWFLNRYGLKMTAVFGACANAAGAWLRFAGHYPGGFWFVLVGTTIASFTNTLEWSAPTMLSNTWFPSGERAIATTVFGALAPQTGILLGLLLGPIATNSPDTDLVCNDNVSRASPAFLDWQAGISHRLLYYLLAQALLASIILPITLLIKDTPPSPPSISSKKKKVLPDESYLKSLFSMFRNGYFLIFTCCCGLLIGASSAYMTVYAEIFHSSGYEQYDSDVGYVGLAAQAFALAAQLVVGVWINRTKTYYFTSLALCIISMASTAGLAVGVQLHISFVFVSVLLVLANGVIRSFLGVGYEYAAEMTYPLPESISAGLVNAMAMLLGIMMIVVTSVMIGLDLARYTNWLYVGLLCIAALFGFVVRPAELKRLNVDSANMKDSLQ